MRIRDRQCATCIYRPGSLLNLPALEDEIRDRHGHFAKARACHAVWPATDVVCAGFAARHGDDCTPVQIVRRLAGRSRPAASSTRP